MLVVGVQTNQGVYPVPLMFHSDVLEQDLSLLREFLTALVRFFCVLGRPSTKGYLHFFCCYHCLILENLFYS